MNIPESNHNRADLGSPVTWTQIERKSPPKALPRLSFQVMRSKNFSLWFEQACRRYSRLSFRYASSDCSHVVGLRSQRREFSRPIGRFATERKELRIVADQIGAPTSTKTIAEAV